MARIDIPYMIAKPGAKGSTKYFWQPSTTLRKLGWRPERLPDDVGQAIERAKALNAQLDVWRQGGMAAAPAAGGGQGDRGPVIRPDTVADLIRRYKTSRFYEGKAAATRRSYDQNLLILENWAGGDLVRHIDPGDIQDLYESFRAKTPAKAAAVIRMARILFQCAVRFNMRPDNPAARPGLEGAAPSGKLWPLDAVLLFVETADKAGRHSLGTAVLVNWWLGQREGDILHLRRNQYRDGRVWITQRKTDARVAVPHSPLVAARIEAEMARLDARHVTSTFLVVNESTGQPYNEHTFRHDFAEIRALAAAEWPTFTLDDGAEVAMTDLRFMHLRHSAITELAIAGATVPQIASISGHTPKSVEQILNRYLVRNSELAEAAAAKRLDREQERG